MCLQQQLLLLAGAAVPSTQAPCDIFAESGTPCVAAHSVVRALFAAYSGPLYEIKRASDGATFNVSVRGPGGTADAKSQDAFCGLANCSIWRIYDQSTKRNHLHIEGGGHSGKPCHGVNASRHPLKVDGQTVYGAYFEGGEGYRNDNTTGIATGNQPATYYMVTSGTHFNSGCVRLPLALARAARVLLPDGTVRFERSVLTMAMPRPTTTRCRSVQAPWNRSISALIATRIMAAERGPGR